MTHYYQLQIAHRFFGPAWHGLALCCFDSEQALREKMYSSAEGKRQITQDILTFADTKNSPRKVVAEVAKSESSLQLRPCPEPEHQARRKPSPYPLWPSNS